MVTDRAMRMKEMMRVRDTMSRSSSGGGRMGIRLRLSRVPEDKPRTRSRVKSPAVNRTGLLQRSGSASGPAARRPGCRRRLHVYRSDTRGGSRSEAEISDDITRGVKT
ncbi:hypothetical protein EYF80_049113 [Liparis tanakae]|uniref:Uncharacterized protein n=1 Tax=Liparis tanakae TaxID=230148 RepID=A0A4Z2FIW9_9TELE|nr:hypothetical protein EYF80_049113 [Liparis tanakae]